MAVLGNLYPTLADVAKSTAPDGSISPIVEILNTTNEMVNNMPWYEGNLPTGHRHTIRTGLPDVTWRKLNYGVMPSTGNEAQITDNCAMLEGISQIDTEIADLNGNTAAFRFSRDKAHIEAMGQELARNIVYGNDGVTPEKFTGLAPRFNTRLPATAQSSDNVIHGGGAGSDNTTIWLIGWGEDKVGGLYPKGSKAGLDQQDMGKVLIQNADGSKYQAYVTHFKWKCGFMVADWRYVVRICNVSVGALTKDAATGADIVDLMTQAIERLPSLSNCKAEFYVNRDIRSMLRRQMVNHKNVLVGTDELAGRKVMMVGEVPVYRHDSILNTEAVVPNS